MKDPTQQSAWRAAFGTLIVLPAVVLLWGSHWDWAGGVDHRGLLVAVWGGWGLVGWASRQGGKLGQIARALGTGWKRGDPWLAALLIESVLFRFPTSLTVPSLIFAVLVLVLMGLRRAPPWLFSSSLVAFVVFAVAVPWAFRTLMIARVAESYALDVDHRPWPDGKEINSDGARFRGEGADLAAQDYVILFVGDSFTYGWDLRYEDAYPYQFETIAQASGCQADIRVVNLGWTSSSPLLGLRLLRQVGYKYKPDLVVYSLDVTDFHDDLRYERSLREQSDFEFDASAMVERLMVTYWPWSRSALPWVREVTERLRTVNRAEREQLLAGLEVPGRLERFFVTARPLAESRPGIELGVMKNLAEMQSFTADVLGAAMAVVIYPRAYQYSDREAARSWELGYDALGPHVREPFRYFAEVAETLPYPVLDLLPAFEASNEFPLFFVRDPHWNPRGAGLAAREVFSGLAARELLPCAPTGLATPE
jgi:hypothetical protein